MSYTYTFSRANFSNSTYDAKPWDYIDADLTSFSDLKEYVLAYTYSITLNGFIGSPTSKSRYADIYIQILCNSVWYTLHQEYGILLESAPNRGNYTFSGSVPVTLQRIIGQSGIQDIRIQNADYGGNSWNIRGYKTGSYGEITFNLIEDYESIIRDEGNVDDIRISGSRVSGTTSPYEAQTNANFTIHWTGESGYVGNWTAFRIYYRKGYTGDFIAGNYWAKNDCNQSGPTANGKYNFSHTFSFKEKGTYEICIGVTTHGDLSSGHHYLIEEKVIVETLSTTAPKFATNATFTINVDGKEPNNDNYVYLGSSSVANTDIVLKWSAADPGKFQTGVVYDIYRNGTIIQSNLNERTYTFESSSLDGYLGYYEVAARGKFSDGGVTTSDAYTTKLGKKVYISAINPGFPISTYLADNDYISKDDNFTITFQIPDYNPTELSETKYRIEFLNPELNSEEFLEIEKQASNSEIAETLTPEQLNNILKFDIRITAIYYARDKGTVSKAIRIKNIQRVTIPELTFLVYDLATESSSTLSTTYFYKDLKWKITALELEGEGRPFEYKIKYSIYNDDKKTIMKGSGTIENNELIYNSTSTSKTYEAQKTFDPIEEQQYVYTEIIVTDTRINATKSFFSKGPIIQVPAPKIRKLDGYDFYISNVNQDGLQINYKYILNFLNVVGVKYYLVYNEIKEELGEATLEVPTTDYLSIQESFTGLKNKIIAENILENSIWYALKEEILTNKNPTPLGKIVIELSRVNMPHCKSIIEEDFNFNFKNNPTSYTGKSIQLIYDNYYQENDVIEIQIPELDWEDIFGGKESATIQYTIEGTGSNNKNHREVKENPKMDENQTYFTYTNFRAPSTDIDSLLQYSINVKLIYKNETVDCGIALCSAPLARWTDKDNIGLTNLTRTEDAISGKLILPDELCSSIFYKNLSVKAPTATTPGEGGEASAQEEGETSIQEGETSTLDTSYSYYKIFKDNNVIIGENFTYDQLYGDSPIRVIDWNYNFIGDQEGDIAIKAEVGFVNAKDASKEFIKITPIYTVYADKVPLAIRKGRVGVNVSSVDFKEEATAIKNSALKIFSAPNSYETKDSSAPVVEIEADGNITNPIFLRFLHTTSDTTGGSMSTTSDFYLDNEGKIHCDNFYYPKQSQTALNGITGESLTLSFLEQEDANNGTVVLEINNNREGEDAKFVTLTGKVKGWDKVLCLDNNNTLTNTNATFNINSIIAGNANFTTITSLGITLNQQSDYPAIIFNKNDNGTIRSTGKIQYQDGLSLFTYKPDESAPADNYWRFYLPTPPESSEDIGTNDYEIITTQKLIYKDSLPADVENYQQGTICLVKKG